MRRALLFFGIALLFLAGAAAGYLYATKWQPSMDKERASREAQASGPYTDAEIVVLRDRLRTIPLPLSQEHVWLLLGIDAGRLGPVDFHGWGNGHNNQNTFTWRLSPTYGIALYEEHGPDFGAKPPANRPITRIAIGKCKPSPGTHPEAQRFCLDEADKEKTEVGSKPSKGSRWSEWQYPNVTRTISSMYDNDNISGGFACGTTDDFDKVLDFYYAKCGVARGTSQQAKGGSDDFMVFRGYDTGPANSAIEARSLNLKVPRYTVNIVVARAKGQKETLIFVNLW